MKVSLCEIEEKFNQLIHEKIPREDISAWAKKRQQAEDEDQLEYDPQDEEQRIWKAITYLIGVDLKDMDGSYLHSIENFINFKNKMKI